MYRKLLETSSCWQVVTRLNLGIDYSTPVPARTQSMNISHIASRPGALPLRPLISIHSAWPLGNGVSPLLRSLASYLKEYHWRVTHPLGIKQRRIKQLKRDSFIPLGWRENDLLGLQGFSFCCGERFPWVLQMVGTRGGMQWIDYMCCECHVSPCSLFQFTHSSLHIIK